MVGVVVVSHSHALAEGVVTLAREMGGDELALEAAGGLDDPSVLGTDPGRIRAAIERAMSADGVLVLMDLGSALMSTEFAIELLGEEAGPVLMSEGPLIEGAVAAAVAARGGATLEQVAAEARGALAMKAAQLGTPEAGVDGHGDAGQPEAAPSPDAKAALLVRNEIGLHARPAARFVQAARDFDAQVKVAKAPGGRPVVADSLTNVLALGARFGDTLLVTAAGSQAREAIVALQALAEEGFGDGVAAGAASPRALATDGATASIEQPEPTSASTPVAGDVLTGVAASSGVASGPARLLRGPHAPPPDRAADGPAAERERLQQGIAGAQEAIAADRELLTQRVGLAEAAIFDAHLVLLEDEALLGPAHEEIEAGTTAERAFYDAADRVAAHYRTFDQALLRERAVDVLDVGQRVVRAITGEQATAGGAGIVIADELTPADAAGLDPALVLGIATARGTATAHAAILARALGLPAVVGIGARVLAIDNDTPVLLDGSTGTLQIDPPPDVLRDAQRARERADERRVAAHARAREPGAMRDGTPIEVFANLGSPAEAARAVELGAEGVGLLRTEFMFLDRDELPGEEEQTETLRAIAVALEGRPLIVRTLDAGADKPLPALPMPAETNPFLGVRGIRVSLRRPELLATQFRAILRVGAEYPLKAMLPMVATLEELLWARSMFEQARRDTAIEAPLELGIMVEVPSAALMASVLAEHADFFSLGTNDLTQYTMAADRGDERLAHLLTGPQPAVLQLVQATVQAAARRGRFVGVCGELAGDPAAAVLLAGLGVTELSMAPGLVPEAKAALREVDLASARAAAERALQAPDALAARAVAAALL